MRRRLRLLLGFPLSAKFFPWRAKKIGTSLRARQQLCASNRSAMPHVRSHAHCAAVIFQVAAAVASDVGNGALHSAPDLRLCRDACPRPLAERR